MTGRRSRTTAFENKVVQTQSVRQPFKRSRSKEEWVIRLVGRIVGTKLGSGFVQADDFASDIILELFNAGGFSWEAEEIEDFCRRKTAFMVRRYVGRRERSECEFTSDGGEPLSILALVGATPAIQELVIDARRAWGLLAAIPRRQRRALEILCGGGTPIDVAEEMRLPAWEAIWLIKEAREYVRRVDPIADAA
jgi:hypothetical protein